MITKEELLERGFSVYFDKYENIFTYDFDRVYFKLNEQTLYDFDESNGKLTKLCKVKSMDEICDLIYYYFKLEVE